MEKMTIGKMDFSYDDVKLTFSIEIEHLEDTIYFICSRINEDGEEERIDALLYENQMKALGKALIFAAEYLEEIKKRNDY